MKNKTKKVIHLLIRILLIIAGLYIIRIYLPPLVSLGVINAGNLFGFCAGGGLALIGIFLKPIITIIKGLIECGKEKATIGTLCAVASIAFVFLIAFFSTLTSIISHSQYTATNETTVIVLGCQIRGSVPSTTLKMRCNVAVDYLNSHPNAVAIATGGQGSDEDLAEGQCIFNLMTEAGIDPNRIYIENKSTNTDENIAFSKKIIEENNLSTDVAIATTDYHQKRAEIICKKNGLTAASIPSNSTKWSKPTFFTREVFGVWAQFLFNK